MENDDETLRTLLFRPKQTERNLPGCAVVYVCERDDKLFVCAVREVGGTYRGLFNVVAGKGDAGDTKRSQIMCREFEEELGCNLEEKWS
jgi:8-oxo-dGTP pyrophosphatase MutT (NUDIX family)